MKYIIIGNGVAGTTAAANIRKIDNEGKIIIISEESYPFYSRIRLPEFLSFTIDENTLIIKKNNWYEKNRIDLFLNTSVTNIDINKKEIITSKNIKFLYDRLLLATGGVSFIPHIPGVDKKGVFSLRTLKDAINIIGYAGKSGCRVLIIGGGVLGIETGYNLHKAGNTVTVVEFFPRLLPRQMDPDGAEILKSQMEKLGLRFYIGANTNEIIGTDKVEGVILSDGRRIDCDMIVLSAGIIHNSVLPQRLGLAIEKGLIVNNKMETGIPDIFAAGDLIQHNGICYGIWIAAEKQGEVSGINMAGGTALYNGTPISNVLKIAGIDLLAAGDIDAEGEKEAIVVKETKSFLYKKIVIQNNTIIGAILYGDSKDKGKILRAIENKKDISSIKKDIVNWNLSEL